MIVIYVFVIDRYAEAKGLGVQVNKTRDAISKSLLSYPLYALLLKLSATPAFTAYGINMLSHSVY